MNFDDKRNYPDYVETIIKLDIPKGQKPERIDKYLARMVENATRSKVQKAIDNGNVEINNNTVKASQKIQGGDKVICRLMKPPPLELIPENISLDIFYEDEYLMVVNKPAGMCVHPGFGNRYGTLVNAVLYHIGQRQSIELEIDEEEQDEEGEIFASDEVRPGIVHRLDKDTSGLLVIAKSSEIHAALASQFAAHKTKREYNAIIWGRIKERNGIISGDIGRSQKNRKAFAVVKKGGKYAETHYETLEEYSFASLVRFHLKTGRTHQIRVHTSHIGHPVIGDSFYGGDRLNYVGGIPEITKIAREVLQKTGRQLLHAKSLGFIHPHTKEELYFESDLPEDFTDVLEIMKKIQY